MLPQVLGLKLPEGVFLKKTGLTIPKELWGQLKSSAIGLPNGNLGLRQLREVAESKGVQVSITQKEGATLTDIDVFRKSQDSYALLLSMPADLGKENLTRALLKATKEIRQLDVRA